MAKQEKLEQDQYYADFKNGKERFEIKVVAEGFEFLYGGKWYSAKEGLISPMLFTPAEQGEAPGPATKTK